MSKLKFFFLPLGFTLCEQIRWGSDCTDGVQEQTPWRIGCLQVNALMYAYLIVQTLLKHPNIWIVVSLML